MMIQLDIPVGMAPKADQRITMLITEEELRLIEDVWHEDRFRSRNEAIRDLLRRGAEARRQALAAPKSQ